MVWCGTSYYQADDLVGAAASPEESDRMQEATAFLQTLLSDGPLPADECLRLARSIAIREKTLRRAKVRLQIRSVRDNDGPLGRWLWELSTAGRG